MTPRQARWNPETARACGPESQVTVHAAGREAILILAHHWWVALPSGLSVLTGQESRGHRKTAALDSPPIVFVCPSQQSAYIAVYLIDYLTSRM